MERRIPAIDIRCGIRYGAGRKLRVGNIVQPFFVEKPQIKVINCFFTPNRNIVEPSHALVPLRTIGRNTMHITAFCPEHHLKAAVQYFLGAIKAACLLHIGIYRLRLNINQLNIAVRLQLRISESMIGEARMPFFFSVTL